MTSHPFGNAWGRLARTLAVQRTGTGRKQGPGWWFGCHQFFIFPEILGISSSQLTNSIIFQRGGPGPPTRGLFEVENLWMEDLTTNKMMYGDLITNHRNHRFGIWRSQWEQTLELWFEPPNFGSWTRIKFHQLARSTTGAHQVFCYELGPLQWCWFMNPSKHHLTMVKRCNMMS